MHSNAFDRRLIDGTAPSHGGDLRHEVIHAAALILRI
jgi:hypothetical protein